jgi:hypothetical protein
MPVRSYYLGYGWGGEKDAGEKASKKLERRRVMGINSLVFNYLQKPWRI